MTACCLSTLRDCQQQTMGSGESQAHSLLTGVCGFRNRTTIDLLLINSPIMAGARAGLKLRLRQLSPVA